MNAREAVTANITKIQAAWAQLQQSADRQSEHQSMALKRAIAVVTAGSQAYGTYRPESDVDLRGVFIAPIEYYFGLGTIEQVEYSRGGEKDTLFELRKFARLATDANPNIVELMFVEPEHILYIHPIGQRLIDNRHEFLSKRCAYSYSGYAFSQLKRIQNHYRWLTNPPVEPAKEKYIAIPRYQHVDTGKIIPVGDYEVKMKRVDELKKAAMGSQDDEDRSFFESEKHWQLIHVLDKDRYERDMQEWNQYQIWRKNRNVERAELEAEYGYDTKHASQLMRLLIQCKQILTEGTLNTFLRPGDRELVMAVRQGSMRYPELLQCALQMNQEIEDLKDKSSLPARVDLQKINKLLVEMVGDYFELSKSPQSLTPF